MKLKPFILLAVGFSWLAVDLNLIVGPIVLRQTGLGVIARFLDKLPSPIANSVDAFLWIVVLLGWIAPLTWGLMLLMQAKCKA